jgi:hypothetical protein
VEIQTYTVGIRGSHDPDVWYAQLLLLEVTVAQAERLMQGMIAEALTKLTDLYSVRYAAPAAPPACLVLPIHAKGAAKEQQLITLLLLLRQLRLLSLWLLPLLLLLMQQPPML